MGFDSFYHYYDQKLIHLRMVQRRWHFRRWTIWLLLKKTTWSSGSYEYELLNHFVCSKDKAHFLQYHTWTVLFLWQQFCVRVYSRVLLVCHLCKYFSHGTWQLWQLNDNTTTMTMTMTTKSMATKSIIRSIWGTV